MNPIDYSALNADLAALGEDEKIPFLQKTLPDLWLDILEYGVLRGRRLEVLVFDNRRW